MESKRHAWGMAFLNQARDDLAGAAAIGPDYPHSFCVLLQMAFEKLGKAFRCRFEEPFDQRRLQKAHKGAYQMLITLAMNSRIKVVQIPFTLQRGAKIHLPLVTALEALQPANAKRHADETGQLEYPWVDTRGQIRYPAKDLQLLKDIRDPLGSKYRPVESLKFASEVAICLDGWLRELKRQ